MSKFYDINDKRDHLLVDQKCSEKWCEIRESVYHPPYSPSCPNLWLRTAMDGEIEAGLKRMKSGKATGAFDECGSQNFGTPLNG
uniref:CPW_WPC domain-containing protein n=1 Tax=Loa loa TaxID=7209 RepID=A0A1I7VL63_LOALO